MASEPEATKASKRRAGRSPGYPVLDVQKAVEQTAALLKQEGDYAAPLDSAAGAWGYSPKSSGGRQTLATLKYYGLIDVTGEGDARRVKASDGAKRIIMDEREDDTEKRALIRKVALAPAAHKALFEEYPNGLPSDGTVLHFLMFTEGFNKEAANELLSEYKKTASYAGLYQPQGVVDKAKENADRVSDKTPPAIKVGDMVQATVNGVDIFDEPAAVLGFSDDGKWVFIEGAGSAAKLEEVTLVEAATVEAPTVERPPIPAHLLRAKDAQPKPGTRTAIFPVTDGDVLLTFPEGISGAGLKSLKRYLDIFLDEKIEATADGPA